MGGRKIRKVSIGSDHAGFHLKEEVKKFLGEIGLELSDKGAFSAEEKVDYPDFARLVAEDVIRGEAQLGILICGTGIGMSITANKFPGIRAALVLNEYMAKMAKAHNNANVIVLSGRVISPEYAKELIKVFLETEFEGGRHERRLKKISEIEGEIRNLNLKKK